MTIPKRGPVFVTGGTGYIGSATVRHLVAHGWQVRVLARSEASVARVAEMGAEPVRGDILARGDWQRVAATCTHAIHLAQPATYGERITRERAARYREERRTMDARLMESLDRAVLEKLVFVTGTSYYGNLGRAMQDESATPKPCGWGPFLADGVDLAERAIADGWPVVQAFPGYVYGDGSWFREYVAALLLRGLPPVRLTGRENWCSPVHIDDCAAALAHLLDHGEAGGRYFIVDDKPQAYGAFYTLAARAIGVKWPALPVPKLFARLAMGPVVGESLSGEAVLSNARLKATGFTFRYPTLAEGIPAVIESMRARRLRNRNNPKRKMP